MEEYISKSVLVAEVEARYNECLKRAKIIDAEYWNGKADAYRDMLVVFDSLKIKEVDLKKEIYDAEKRFGDIDEMGGYRILIFDDDFRDILRHFFELGLKVQKGE